MIDEQIKLTKNEEEILRSIISKKFFKISSEQFPDSYSEFMWPIYATFEDSYIKIEDMDIVSKLFDLVEDGTRPSVSMSKYRKEHDIYTKNINRIVQDVFIVTYSFEFEADEQNEAYKIAYPKAIIFNFNDCNFIIEKYWIFTLGGLFVYLEPFESKNFGFHDEVGCWYYPGDTALDGRVPIVTQIVHSLKQGTDISIKHGLDL